MKNIIAALALVSLFASANSFAKGGDDKDKKAKKSCCTKMEGKSSCSKEAKKACGDGHKAAEKNS